MADVRVVDVTPEGFGLERLISAFIVIGDERVAVVDPGPESSRPKLRGALESMGVKPDFIIVTHVHLDHGGAAGGLAHDYPQAIVAVHPRGAPHLADPTRLWEASRAVLGPVAEVYARPVPAPRDRIHAAPDRFTLDLGGEELEVVHTPGHASHHMSVYARASRIIFTGDSAGVIIHQHPYTISIPTTPPPFKPDLYIESLHKMSQLNPASVAPTHYGVHEDGSHLEVHERQVKEWLRVAEETGVSDPDEYAAILASIDENVKLLLAIPELRPIKHLFLDTTLQGILHAIRAR